MNTILQAHQLEKDYGEVKAVCGLDLEVAQGQIYGFLGPNGAGKTTTIRMLLGLIRPTKGEVRLFGEPLQTKRTALLRHVGSIVESPSAYAHLTGWENLELTRRMLGAPSQNIPRLLKMVGLEQAAHRSVRGYSLGMKGRLSLAAALLNNPKLLILDEPTNGLDPAGIREIRDLIRTFPAEGITVLISSHLLAEMEQIATHVGIVTAGKMRFSGPLEQLRYQSSPRTHIEVDQPDRAFELIRGWYPDVSLKDGRLEVGLPSHDIPKLNRHLVEANFAVSRIESLTQSLEDLFLKVTAKENQ